MFGMGIDEAAAWFFLPSFFDRTGVGEWRWGENDIGANKALNKFFKVRSSQLRDMQSLLNMFSDQYAVEGGPEYHTRWCWLEGSRPASDGPESYPHFLPDCCSDIARNVGLATLLSGRYIANVEFATGLHNSLGLELGLDALRRPGEWVLANYPDYAVTPGRRGQIQTAWTEAVAPGAGAMECAVRQSLLGKGRR